MGFMNLSVISRLSQILTYRLGDQGDGFVTASYAVSKHQVTQALRQLTSCHLILSAQSLTRLRSDMISSSVFCVSEEMPSLSKHSQLEPFYQTLGLFCWRLALSISVILLSKPVLVLVDVLNRTQSRHS